MLQALNSGLFDTIDEEKMTDAEQLVRDAMNELDEQQQHQLTGESQFDDRVMGEISTLARNALATMKETS